MENVLRECPFCFSLQLLAVGINKDVKADLPATSVVICRKCGARGPSELSTEAAIDSWNMRRPYDALRNEYMFGPGLVSALLNLMIDDAAKSVSLTMNRNMTVWIETPNWNIPVRYIKVQDFIKAYQAKSHETYSGPSGGK